MITHVVILVDGAKQLDTPEFRNYVSDAFDGFFTSVSFVETCSDEVLNVSSGIKSVGRTCVVAETGFSNPGVISNDIVRWDGSSHWQGVASQVKWILTDYGRDRRMNDNIFFTSDTHFYHENIIRYCSRPFSNVEEMNETLVENWNQTVSKNDTVWHLGDFSLGGKENVEIVKRLNGRINLVLGNHDHQKFKLYCEAGFNRVYDRPVVINNFVILSHAPLEWVQDPMFNVFGHVHSNPNYSTFSRNGCCVCVERHGYAPVSWREITESVKKC